MTYGWNVYSYMYAWMYNSIKYRLKMLHTKTTKRNLVRKVFRLNVSMERNWPQKMDYTEKTQRVVKDKQFSNERVQSKGGFWSTLKPTATAATTPKANLYMQKLFQASF